MAKQIERLAPLRGLNPTNVGEEAALQGTFMRGGYNVEVVDAEWWVRHGCGQVSKNIGSIWWRWMVSSPSQEKCFLVSNNYVVQIDSQVAEPGVPDALGAPIEPPDPPQFFGEVDIPYLHNHTMNVTFTYASSLAVVNSVSGGTQTVGQIFQIEGFSGVNDQIYRIVARPTAGSCLIDRPLERTAPGSLPPGATYTLATLKVYDPCIASPSTAAGELDSDLDGGCVLYEQTAAHATNTLGYVNDAASPGSYIIMVSRSGYAAVPMSALPIARSFLRQTQLPTPTPATFKNMRPGVYKDRLFMQADDPNGASGFRTFWYSRPFDFMQWHTGLQGLGGTANYFTLVDPTDPISGFMVQGDTLVVHRRSSQDIIQTYGAGFKATHNDAGMGFWPRSMMEAIPTGHIGWTRYGPGLFNQEGMTVMFPELERMLAAFNQSQRMNPRLRGVLHDQNRRRVYFLLGWEATGLVYGGDTGIRRIIRHQDASVANPQAKIGTSDQAWYTRSPVLVVDYARNEAWLEDHAGLCGGGDHLGQMYLFRYDGTVLNHPTGWSGKDFDVARTNALTPVDAWVETQWMAHGVPQRKMLQKIYLTFRALDVDEDVDKILGGKFDPLRISDLWDSPTDTLHLCTVEVMCDNRDDVQARSDVSILVSDMLARSLEGNRMLPVMLFSITPRVAGRSFKYRFKTALSPAAAAAGHKLGSFRLVDAVIEFEVETDTRAAGLTGGSP